METERELLRASLRHWLDANENNLSRRGHDYICQSIEDYVKKIANLTYEDVRLVKSLFITYKPAGDWCVEIQESERFNKFVMNRRGKDLYESVWFIYRSVDFDEEAEEFDHTPCNELRLKLVKAILKDLES